MVRFSSIPTLLTRPGLSALTWRMSGVGEPLCTICRQAVSVLARDEKKWKALVTSISSLMDDPHWYFSSAEIIDFHHLRPYPWLAWNAHPERKHLWMTEDQRTLYVGHAVYQHDKSLAARRYFPDEDLGRSSSGLCESHGSETFFRVLTGAKGSNGWRQTIVRHMVIAVASSLMQSTRHACTTN